MDIRSTRLGHYWQNPSVKAVLLLSLVMILTTVIATTVVLLDLRQKELAHAKGEVLSLTGVLSEQTTRTFEGVALMLQGTRERISDTTGRHLDLDSVPVQLLLRTRTAGLPQVKSLLLLDRQGIVVNSSHGDPVAQLSVNSSELLKRVDGSNDGIFITPPEKSQTDESWSFYAGLRILDDSGQLRGVLIASINVNYFESLYKSIVLDSVSRIQLFDHNGILLAGKPRDEGRFGQAIADTSALSRLNAFPEGQAVEIGEAADQDRWLVVYRKVAEFPLVISAAANEDEALTPWRRVMRPLASGAFAVVSFVLLVSILLVKNLVRESTLESALKEADDQLRHTVQSAKDAIVTANSAKRIVLFNRTAEQMFGLSAGVAIGSEIESLLRGVLRPPELMQISLFLKEAWQSPNTLGLLCIVRSADGKQEFPVELSLSTTRFRDEVLLTVIVRDLSERQRAERELLETNRQLQQLSASLQTVREEQRARISRELHDELGQLLTGIRMEVSWLGRHLPTGEQVLIDKIGSVKNQIDQTISSIRRISSELRPLVLDDLGFAAAATWYVDQFSERTGLPVDLVLPTVDPQRGDVVTTALFRIVQESLTNVARHANATKVEVRLDFQKDVWALSVKDDGSGFVHDPRKLDDIGLIGMRERAQTLGGYFSVTTEPGSGTEIKVLIPAAKIQEEP